MNDQPRYSIWDRIAFLAGCALAGFSAHKWLLNIGWLP